MIRSNRVNNSGLDDSDWNFMDVLDVQGNNYEYFNDIRDIEFDKRKAVASNDLFAIAALAAIVVLGAIVVVLLTGTFKDDGYKELLEMQSVQQSLNTTYVAGDDATSDEIVMAAETLDNYFSILAAEEDYSGLGVYCTGSSSFADTYYANTAKVVEFYDSNDCYARALRRFAAYCRCLEVTRLIKDNDVYYCYFKFAYPNSSDVQSYIHLNSYDLTKYFQSKEVSEENIMMCFLNMSSQNKLSYHAEEYCVKMEVRDDRLVLINDSFMVDVCSSAYSEYLKQCSGLLGSSKISK